MIKFKAMMTKRIIHDSKLEELKYWCRIFHLYNLAPNYNGVSYGNLSFRTRNNQFIITASGLPLKDNLSDDCFVLVSSCNLKKKIIYAHGIRKPSSETMLHYAIYKKRKDVNAIFHGHSQKILLSKLKFPETKREEPYGTIKLAHAVLEVLDNNNFLIMKNHGFLSLGKNMKEAGKLAVKMYEKSISAS